MFHVKSLRIHPLTAGIEEFAEGHEVKANLMGVGQFVMAPIPGDLPSKYLKSAVIPDYRDFDANARFLEDEPEIRHSVLHEFGDFITGFILEEGDFVDFLILNPLILHAIEYLGGWGLDILAEEVLVAEFRGLVDVVSGVVIDQG